MHANHNKNKLKPDDDSHWHYSPDGRKPPLIRLILKDVFDFA
jgi:hypothetical protein